MTNYEHRKIMDAVNEMNDLHREFKDVDEVLEIYTYEEVLDMIFRYEGFIGHTEWIMRNIYHFYNLIPRTVDEIY